MRRAWLVIWALILSVTGGSAALAEDFRIDTDLYIGNQKTPSAEVLTIFQGGIAYDFQGSETMILDHNRGRLTLLNTKKQQRATLETAELLDATISLQTEALKSKNATTIAAANPQFQKAADAVNENGNALTRLTFKSAPLQYTVLGQPSRVPEAVQEYKYVADWSARLNSIRTGMPAAARLEVNEALAAKGLLPYRIERVMADAKTREVRTQHLVNWKLSQDDHRRIDEANTQFANFKLVGFEEYTR